MTIADTVKAHFEFYTLSMKLWRKLIGKKPLGLFWLILAYPICMPAFVLVRKVIGDFVVKTINKKSPEKIPESPSQLFNDFLWGLFQVVIIILCILILL